MDGIFLVVVSKGSPPYVQQAYKVDPEGYPSMWVSQMMDKGFYVTSLATARDAWAVVMSRGGAFAGNESVCRY